MWVDRSRRPSGVPVGGGSDCGRYTAGAPATVVTFAWVVLLPGRGMQDDIIAKTRQFVVVLPTLELYFNLTHALGCGDGKHRSYGRGGGGWTLRLPLLEGSKEGWIDQQFLLLSGL